MNLVTRSIAAWLQGVKTDGNPNHATTTASHKRSGAITLAAILKAWFGLACLISRLLIVISGLRNGELPMVFGIEILAGPFSQRLGLNAVIAATVPWGS